MNTQAQPPKQDHPIVVLRRDVERGIDEFRKVLPPSITPEAFARVSITAVQRNPDLLKADRHSLLIALMQAAEDGLLPDGREGALVTFGNKVQWLPMVEGVRKRLWESAGIVLSTCVVYARDDYDYERGDNERIFHRPKPGPRSEADVIAVYSIAKAADGRVWRDWMWKSEIDQIAAKSRSSGGPWKDPVFYPEMAIKTVVHHHSKSLPMSVDLRRMIERDNALYQEQPLPARPAPAGEPLPALEDKQTIEFPISQATTERTVAGVMAAMATGQTVEAPKRRGPGRPPKPQTVAPAPSRALHEPLPSPQAAGEPAAPLVGTVDTATQQERLIVFEPDGSAHYADTGEVYEETNEAAEATSPQQGEVTTDTMTVLKVLMNGKQPGNREEYLAFIQSGMANASAPSHIEALRQYWTLTGGMRQQFGVTKEDTAKLAEQLRRPEAT